MVTYRFGRYFRTAATAWSTPATAPKSAMICLTVSLRGLPMWTLPEAQTLLEEPYGPEGRRAATGAAGPVWQSERHHHNQDEGCCAPHPGCPEVLQYISEAYPSRTAAEQEKGLTFHPLDTLCCRSSLPATILITPRCCRDKRVDLPVPLLLV